MKKHVWFSNALPLFSIGIEKYSNQIVHCNKNFVHCVCKKGGMLNVKFKDTMERLHLVPHMKNHEVFVQSNFFNEELGNKNKFNEVLEIPK